MSENKTTRPYAFDLASSLLALTLIIALLYVLQGVLLPLMFAILIAIALYPVAVFLEKLHLGKLLASLLSVLFAIIVISGLLWFIVYEVIVIGKDAAVIQEKFLSIFDTFQLWLQNQFGIEHGTILAQLKEQTNQLLSRAGTYLTSAFGSLGSMIGSAVLVPLFAFFLLHYRVFFREFFFHAFKSSPKDVVNDTLNKIYDVVQSYLVGLVTVMGIVAVLNTVGLWVLGVQYAWFFGTLASLLMLLPYIGIAIGSILPAIFALATKDSAWYAIGVIGWFQVVQFLEGNIITPNIVGSKVSINPLMAIISILLGGMLFGLAGLILALPLTASLKVLFDAIPSMKAFGFLIGEPEKHHLRKNSTKMLLMRWNLKELMDLRQKKEKELEEEETELPNTPSRKEPSA
jgi:predicted PurR-regulated permease PerM